MREIENAFTIEHLKIAKMVALGCSIKEIANRLHYSVASISLKMIPLYIRYDIDIRYGRTIWEREKLYNILRSKLNSKASITDNH